MDASPDTPEAADVEFSLVTGDLLHHAQRVIGLIPARGLGTGRRIVIGVALTWLPLMLWALWNHLLLPGVAEEPLLRHFAGSTLAFSSRCRCSWRAKDWWT